jgi:isoquinoline 1-oxidoreductase beta subunit
VQIAPSGEVTVTINRLEFGQGVQTGLPMILAEELDADWSLVRSRNGSNDAAYFDPLFGIHLTGGSNCDQEQLHPVPRTRCTRAGHAARGQPQRAGTRMWPACRTQAGIVLAPDGRKQAMGNWLRPRWRCLYLRTGQC